MDTKAKPLPTPLSRLKDLQAVEPGKVSALETRLKQTYVAGMTEYSREARLRAEAVRNKILY